MTTSTQKQTSKRVADVKQPDIPSGGETEVELPHGHKILSTGRAKLEDKVYKFCSAHAAGSAYENVNVTDRMIIDRPDAWVKYQADLHREGVPTLVVVDAGAGGGKERFNAALRDGRMGGTFRVFSLNPLLTFEDYVRKIKAGTKQKDSMRLTNVEKTLGEFMMWFRPRREVVTSSFLFQNKQYDLYEVRAVAGGCQRTVYGCFEDHQKQGFKRRLAKLRADGHGASLNHLVEWANSIPRLVVNATHSYYYLSDSDKALLREGDTLFAQVHRFEGRSGQLPVSGKAEFYWRRDADDRIIMTPAGFAGTTYGPHDDAERTLRAKVERYVGAQGLDCCIYWSEYQIAVNDGKPVGFLFIGTLIPHESGLWNEPLLDPCRPPDPEHVDEEEKPSALQVTADSLVLKTKLFATTKERLETAQIHASSIVSRLNVTQDVALRALEEAAVKRAELIAQAAVTAKDNVLRTRELRAVTRYGISEDFWIRAAAYLRMFRIVPRALPRAIDYVGVWRTSANAC